jgi:molybdopterin-containing oxidoreductase family membrane subunit
MNKLSQLVLGLLALIGIGSAVGKVFIWGDSVVNYGSYVPWGLWVSLYIFLVVAAAGATWFGFLLGYKNNSVRWIKLGFGSAAISLIGALAFIALDLGKPMKGISIFFSPSFMSPSAWASWGYALFILTVAIIMLKGISNVRSPLVYVGLALSILFLGAETLLFGNMIARPLWNSWGSAFAFVTSAIVAGGALVYGVAALWAPDLLQKDGIGLRKLLLYAIVLHLVVKVGHLALETNLPEAMAQMTDWRFWVLFVGLGGLVAIYLLTKPATALLGSVLSLFGVLVFKVTFVTAAFTQPDLSGLPEAFQDSRLSLSYTPSIVEWLIAVGLLAAVVLAISWLIPKVLVDHTEGSTKSNKSV